MLSPDHAASDAHSLSYHGGRLDHAASRYPDAPRPWIDLSTGINPFAWPVARMTMPDLRMLPGSAAQERLCAVAGARFGAERLALTALPGSEIGLRMLAQLDLPRPWRIVAPGYRTHADALPGAEAIDASVLAEDADRGGTVLLANPNNPDGYLWSPDTLLSVARTLAARGGMLIVDEAFVDAVPGASILPLLGSEDRVLVFRSFGKFFGLAGVRLGFVGGAADAVAAIAARLGSWPVSTLAMACGTLAYADDGWIAAMPDRLADARDALDRMLLAHGLTGQGACPLFRLVETTDAPAIFERLARAGILVRPFDYAPNWLRFGLPADAEASARLDKALGNR